MGAHLIQPWSSTQPTIILSSGEAELHGAVRAAAAGLGFLSLLADFGVTSALRVCVDWQQRIQGNGCQTRSGQGPTPGCPGPLDPAEGSQRRFLTIQNSG